MMNEAPVKSRLHVFDYLLFAAVLLLSISIGLYHAFTGGKQRTTTEYLMANRKLRTLPVALSMLVSFISSILVLGMPAEMYTRGTQIVMRVVGYCLSCIISAAVFVPLLYPLQLTSVYQYLEMRFQSKGLKMLNTFMMILFNVVYMAIVMYAPSTALEAVTGFPVSWSILCICVVSTVYTTLGGIRAVVWTDVFQAVVMIGGMLSIVVQGSISVGGLQKVWHISEKGGRINFLNFNPDPTQRLSFWSLVSGGICTSLLMFGVGQSSVQRYSALPTLKQAQRSVLLNIPGLLIVNILSALTGLVIYAYYTDKGCDPLKQKYISNANQLVPYFVLDQLSYPGFPGLFLAVLCSGSLSSLSTCLNSLTAVTWEDFLKQPLKNLSESRKTLVTKLIVIGYASIGLGLAFLAEGFGGHVLQLSLSLTGITGGPGLGVFLLAAFFPKANAKGTVIGSIVALSFSLWVTIGSILTRSHRVLLPTVNDKCPMINGTNFTTVYNLVNTSTVASDSIAEPQGLDHLYRLSFLWYGAVGAVITVVIGIIASHLTGKLGLMHSRVHVPFQ